MHGVASDVEQFWIGGLLFGKGFSSGGKSKLFALCCRFLSSFEDLEGVLLFSLSYDHIFL